MTRRGRTSGSSRSELETLLPMSSLLLSPQSLSQSAQCERPRRDRPSVIGRQSVRAVERNVRDVLVPSLWLKT